MATQDVSPSLIIGHHWSALADLMSASTDNADEGSDNDGNKPYSDSMKLRRQDMDLFGFCPSRDEFSLVVCEKCNLLVKPQALKQHIESRHGPTNLSSLGNIPASALNSELGKKLLMPLPTKCVAPLQTTITSSSERQVSGTFKPMSSGWPPTKAGLKQVSASNKNVSAPILGVSMKISPIKSVKSGHRIITAATTASSTPVVKVEKLEKVSNLSQADQAVKYDSIDVTSMSSNILSLENTKIRTLVNGSIKPPVISLTSPSTSATISSLVSAPLLIAVTKTSADMPLNAKSITTFVSTASGTKPLVIAPVMTNGSAATVAPRPVSSTKSTKSQKDHKERKFLPCKDREYDANKHCGVTVAETGKQCTRSLTCKTHALSLRRAVPGRNKSFDELLKEHKAAKEALLKARADSQNAAAAAAAGSVTGPANRVQVSPTAINSSTIFALKQPVIVQHDGKLVHAQSVPVRQRGTTAVTSSSVPAESTQFFKPGSIPNVFHRLTSSVILPQSVSISVKEEGAVCNDLSSIRTQAPSHETPPSTELQETRLHQNYLSHHPKPIANTQFGGRVNDRSCFLFSRRVDYIRAALLSALDIQLNPLPHKKLCVESNLPKEMQVSCSTQDPYEFNMVDSSGAAANTLSPSLVSATKLAVKSKSKLLTPPVIASSTSPLSVNLSSGTVSAPLSLSTCSFSTLCATPIAVSSAVSPSSLTLNWPVKSWDSVNSRSPSASPSPALSSTPAATSSGKRKRSGSGSSLSGQFLAVASSNGALPTVSGSISAINIPVVSGQQTKLSELAMPANINHHQTTNLIAIPSVNLANTGLGQLATATPCAKLTPASVASQAASHKNNIFKDFNLVLTGIDPSLVNGQYVNITGAQLAELAASQGQALFLNSFSSGANNSSQSGTTSSINLASSVPTSRPAKRSRNSALKLNQTMTNSAAAGKISANSLEDLKLIPSGSILPGTLPSNAILMDGGSLQGAVLTSVALATAGTSPALVAITSTTAGSGRTGGITAQGPAPASSTAAAAAATFVNGVSQSTFGRDKSSSSSSSSYQHSSIKPHHQHSKYQQQQQHHGITVSNILQASPSLAVPVAATTGSAAQLCSSQAIFKPGGTFSLAATNVAGKLTMQPVSLKFPISVSQAGLADLTSAKSSQQQQPSQHAILVAAGGAGASEAMDPAGGVRDMHLQAQISGAASAGNLIS